MEDDMMMRHSLGEVVFSTSVLDVSQDEKQQHQTGTLLCLSQHGVRSHADTWQRDAHQCERARVARAYMAALVHPNRSLFGPHRLNCKKKRNNDADTKQIAGGDHILC
jgi:hypothetical protein